MKSYDAATVLSKVGAYFLLNQVAFDISDFELLNPSFSLGGEDLLLRKCFKERLAAGAPGFYVDLGSFDPRAGSNTYLFYCYGWRGVCIDANPHLYKRFCKTRPRDAVVHAAISDCSSSWLYFAAHNLNQGMSRVAATADDFDEQFSQPIQVPVATLAGILKQHVPAGVDIDFMSVDLENSELAALRSNDWSLFRPKMILIEAHGINVSALLDHPSIAYLAERGYVCEHVMASSALMKLSE